MPLPAAPLTLRFLGEPHVERNGVAQPFPPSKKTRALLAYLALNNKSFHRDSLCELLWEAPDDPKGSLRWSLSKLRRLVDDGDKHRIIADRAQVSFDGADACIDVFELQRWSEKDLQHIDLDELRDACEYFSGKFLNGFDLPNFPEFYLWCISLREKTTQQQAALLSTLVQRLNDEEAVPLARNLVSLVPSEQKHHAALIRLLVKLNRTQDAKQQFELSKKMLLEHGLQDTQLLISALRAPIFSTAAKIDSNINDYREEFLNENSTKSVDVFQVNVEGALEYSRRKIHGRQNEIEQLATTFKYCVDHLQAKVVLVRGDPGIGKSSLMQCAVRLVQKTDAWLLHADAFESEIIRPFGLWNDAYRRSSRHSVPAVLDNHEHTSRDKIFSAISDSITQQTRQRPLILIFDDIQWCDESSAAVLHYVMRMNRNHPVFALLASREQELQNNAAVLQALSGLRSDQLLMELKLGPLSQHSLEKIISEQCPSADAKQLSLECGGNPLLAIELARAAGSGTYRHSLTGLMQERLSRLDKTVIDVLQWASVLEPHLEYKMLKRVTELPLEALEKAISIGEQQGILATTERGLRFSHNLIARCIYQQISPARRQLMHHRSAEILEVDTTLDLQLASDLAHHAEKSGNPAMAARAMVSAGRLCMRFFANEKAKDLATRGLLFAEQLKDIERVCITLELREILWTVAPTPNWQQAAEQCVTLAEQALDHGALRHARMGYQLASQLRWLHGAWKDAQRDSLQAERITRSGDDADHILGMAEAAKCLALLEKDLSQADALIMEACTLAKRKDIHVPAIATALGILRYYANELDQAEEFLEEARTSYKANGDRINEYLALEYLAIVEITRGDFVQAKRHCQQLLKIGEHFSDSSEGPFARALDCLCHYALTADSSLLNAPLAALRACDAKHRLAYTLTRAALLDIDNHQIDSALQRANEALKYTQLLHRPSEEMLAHVALALAFQQKQQFDNFNVHIDAIHELDKQHVANWARQQAASKIPEFE